MGCELDKDPTFFSNHKGNSKKEPWSEYNY